MMYLFISSKGHIDLFGKTLFSRGFMSNSRRPEDDDMIPHRFHMKV